MNDKDYPYKDAHCDLLMKEGIEGLPDEDAVNRTISLSTLAIEIGRKDCLERALAWHEDLERREICDELAIFLDFNRANAIAGNRYGTHWQWEQPTLVREIFYLRRAVSNPCFSRVPDVTRCAVLNNLGSRLRVAGRLVDSLEYWRRALEVQPNFGMALCNRAGGLVNYAKAIEDPGKRALLFLVAHKEASAALASTAIYMHPHDEHTRKAAKGLKEWIESFLDIEGISAIDPLTWEDTSTTEAERGYRRWCLANRLYLNEANDLGQHTVATTDTLVLPSHVVSVDAPQIFESFFDQMKQEYVSARWMLYEGLSAEAPHFSDRDVYLYKTEPHPRLSLAIERIKAAYRISYSLFDKIGFFLNGYMSLGIPEREVSFRRLWRSGEKQPIRNEFDQTGNWGLCALYWLAKDFYEKKNDEVAEPEAQSLSDIRNHLEHKYLRIVVDERASSPPDDLALIVSSEQFVAKALHLLRRARSALIYLVIGVGLEERRRQTRYNGMPIEELRRPPELPDADKI
ncbi:MAG: LA2681 family HEPN domain-containing protein [Thermoguttaceae bacterium]|jgi:hypothetical protein